MREYFEKIEHNNYLDKDTSGHGFTGWLQTNIADCATHAASTLRFKVFEACLRLVGKDPEKVLDYLTSDGNYLDPMRDQSEGLWSLPFHVTPNWKRFSPRDRVLETRNLTNATLHLQLESLTTRVLFDSCSGDDTKPRAVGVEYLQGKSVYKADPRRNASSTGTLHQAFARKEVIVSGGTFNSPQILQLSGIGPSADLRRSRRHTSTAVTPLRVRTGRLRLLPVKGIPQSGCPLPVPCELLRGSTCNWASRSGGGDKRW